MPRRRRTPYIPILTGVTLAFVLASLGFIALMVYYNNPFTQVAELPVPNLVGLKYETVVAQHDNIEIVPEDTAYNDEYGKGVIFEQKPKAGTKIKEGATVRVMISSGQQIVPLPNFTGKDVNQTISKLKELGLEPKEERIFSSDYPVGSVVYTDPSKDSELPSGTMVTVYVSRGPEERLENVPDLSGLDVEGARAELERFNLTLGDVTEAKSDQPEGTVVSQNPPANGLQLAGTSVDIVISKEGIVRYNFPIPLPDLDYTVLMRARIGNDEDNYQYIEENLNPKQTEVWKPVFTGEPIDEDILIRISIDGRRYQEYYLNFADGSRRLHSDRSDAEEFQGS